MKNIRKTIVEISNKINKLKKDDLWIIITNPDIIKILKDNDYIS